MKIQAWLHKILFPSYERKLKSTDKERLFAYEKIKELQAELRKPNYADLMRDNLGSIKVDFTQNPDYLDVPEDERKSRIVQGNELYKNEMFGIIYTHLVNEQGNFTLKKAVNDAQIFTGRMNINGLTLFKNEVNRCHTLFEEMTTPEEFDPNEVI